MGTRGYVLQQEQVTGSGNATPTLADSGTTYVNNGAYNIALPAAPTDTLTEPEYSYIFIVGNASYLKVTANGTDVIRYKDTTTAAGGYVRSQTLGNLIKIRCVVGGEWLIENLEGTWTYDS